VISLLYAIGIYSIKSQKSSSLIDVLYFLKKEEFLERILRIPPLI
jgi:hypothetical protein